MNAYCLLLSSIYVENHSTLLCDIIMTMFVKKSLTDGWPVLVRHGERKACGDQPALLWTDEKDKIKADR